ncbi:MAG: carbohydrate ABC transporter permease [Geodermatophilaceae bacterium]|nr:carbohydrate ABC transporter permease [Geodermatophilaceae bacterium]
MTATMERPSVPQEELARQALGAPRRGVASRIASRTGGGFIQVFLVLIAIFWTVPAIGLFVSSLVGAQDSGSGWWTFLLEPAQLSLDNYSNLLSNDDLVGSFLNTVLITVPSTLGVVLVGSLAAYAFAWMQFWGRDWIFLIVIGLLVVPVQVGLIPVAELYGQLGIFGSIPGVVIFHIAFGLPFAIFLLRNFFAGIPRDLLEAARMDGASEWTIFRRVVLPLGLPAIASLAIFQFLWVWNDFLIALVFAGRDVQPLTVFLQSQTRQFGESIDVLAPGAFLSLIVPLIVFFSFQRYFVQGTLAGSVK